MTNKIEYIKTSQSILILSPKKFSIPKSHINYEAINQWLDKATSKSNFNSLVKLIDYQEILKKTKNNLSLKNGRIIFHNKEGKNFVIENEFIKERVGTQLSKKEDLVNLNKFFEKLYLNPNPNSILDLYGFLKVNDLPILKNGNFLGSKIVKNNYFDYFSGTFDNHVGNTLEIKREDVNPDRNMTCSTGLHICSAQYITYYISEDSKLLIVEVSPTDVVAVPPDYNGSKLRCCKYKVIDEVPFGNLRPLAKQNTRYIGSLRKIIKNVFDIFYELYGLKEETDLKEEILKVKSLNKEDELMTKLYLALSKEYFSQSTSISKSIPITQEWLYNPYLVVKEITKFLGFQEEKKLNLHN